MKIVFSFLIYVAFISSAYALPQCEGDDETKWQNCEGTLTHSFNDKDVEYVGVFKDGIFEGENEELEIIYVGEYKNGTMHGQGAMTFPFCCRYVGDFKYGKWEGRGTSTMVGEDLQSFDGVEYIGEFRDNLMHGKGTITLLNGDKIKGYWREGKEFGTATYIFKGGDEIEGYFKDGEFVPK